MGTRGVLGFRYQDTDKVMYNHWDSYPSGLGTDVIDIIRTYNDEQLAGTASRITLIDENVKPTPDLIERYAEFTDLGVSEQSTDDWYCLLRRAQGKLAPYIDGRVDHIEDSADFLLNSLFCEWAYILNCDTRELEVYKGFNNNPAAPGRYAALGEGNYVGVALISTMPFDTVRALSEEGLGAYIRDLEGIDEDEMEEE